MITTFISTSTLTVWGKECYSESLERAITLKLTALGFFFMKDLITSTVSCNSQKPSSSDFIHNKYKPYNIKNLNHTLDQGISNKKQWKHLYSKQSLWSRVSMIDRFGSSSIKLIEATWMNHPSTSNKLMKNCEVNQNHACPIFSHQI